MAKWESSKSHVPGLRVSGEIGMAKWEASVFSDVVLSQDNATVHRTDVDVWHGVVGSPVLHTGIHTFEITLSGFCIVGVADANAAFTESVSGNAWGLMWDGQVMLSAGAATQTGSTNGRTIAQAMMQHVEMRVDMTARRLAFRRWGPAEWEEAGVELPAVVRPWALLGSGEARVTIAAYRMEIEPGDARMHADLARDLGMLYCSENQSDVTLVIGDTRLPAHSAILAARSKVFAAMLKSPMRESITKEVVLEDVDVDIMREMLRFLYTGGVEPQVLEEDSGTMALLQAAHHFEVPLLEECCAQVVGARLQVETAAEVLQAADSMNCLSLRDTCLAFVAAHVAEVQTTDGFRHLAESRPSLMLDLVAAIVPPLKKLTAHI